MNIQFEALIIDSKKEENNQISTYLQSKGYYCQQIYTNHDIYSKIEGQRYDYIIMEDEFFNINTMDLIAHAKTQYNPIIIVLSHTLSHHYLDSLLNSGADDYLIIPFEFPELTNKMESIYKNGILKPRQIYHFKDITLDKDAQTCFSHQKPLLLTKNEFKLLSILISHPYQPFSISYLFEQVWGSSLYEDGTSIPALINSLIIKLNNNNPNQEYIKRFGKSQYKMAF